MSPTKQRTNRSGYALGVDIGGTFTDVALLDRSTSRLLVGKVLTNYTDLAAGVLEGIRDVLDAHQVSAQEIMHFVHGTTLATNALIQRRGARTALIVTAGFRDVLEMARECRYEIYDLEIDLPAPLVPRSLVFQATERVDAEGRVITTLDEHEVRMIARTLSERGIEAVAVCLLHSFRNPVHERAIAEIFRREAPGIAVSVSSDVNPNIGEFERASTTVANAYVRPTIERYLDRLAAELKTLNVKAPPFIMTSDGGAISAETAIRYPVRLIESGPAGGVLASVHFGKRTKLRNLLAFDMGGTTAKICIIDDGRPTRSDRFEVGRVYRFAKGSGLPLKVPVLEMIEIGAGGGSIAHADELGLFRVGPESAGAAPGPACYGLGGSVPTVTDADLCLGYLDPDFFLGGRMPLDRKRAERAILEKVAKPVGLSLTRAAWGIHTVVNDNMARAAKIHCLERGKDPRRYTLVAFGGAGPVHAYRVAETLGIRQVLYPARAGVMSAFGFLVAPAAFELLRADSSLLADVHIGRLQKQFTEMEAEGRRLLRSAGVKQADIEMHREAAVRYRGQSSELFIEIPRGRLSRRTLDQVKARFERQYRAQFHRLNPHIPLEVVNWRAVVSGPTPRITLRRPPRRRSLKLALKGRRKVYLPETQTYEDCPVYDRYLLPSDSTLRGPAIIEEVESTVVVGPGARIAVDALNNLLVSLGDSGVAGGRRRAARKRRSKVAS
ncbi:MAG: hydantoinase/oxoprolinase family protein [Alphaproteobacteria bacterium]|nr:hydantoinase/oxoprolinase family protein [Alphaproteobacteria bacterium]